jgi:hypothetical protein
MLQPPSRTPVISYLARDRCTPLREKKRRASGFVQQIARVKQLRFIPQQLAAFDADSWKKGCLGYVTEAHGQADLIEEGDNGRGG